MELERRLAEFKKVEKVVVFQSGFAANAGTVSAILDERGRRHLGRVEPRQHHRRLPAEPRRRSRSSRTRTSTPRAGSSRSCRRPSASCSSPTASSAWTATSGRCPALCELAEETGCIMMVDDAHASGVFGKNGRGTVDHFGMHGRVDIQVGTLSKAIGALGGYVAGNAEPDRLPLSPGASVPVLDLASAGRRRGLHGRAGRPDGGAGNHRTVVGQHSFLQRGAAAARVQHRPEREPDHAGHRGRGSEGDDAVGQAVRARRLRPGHRVPDRGARQGPRPHDRDRDAHARGSAVSRSTPSPRSAGRSA